MNKPSLVSRQLSEFWRDTSLDTAPTHGAWLLNQFLASFQRKKVWTIKFQRPNTAVTPYYGRENCRPNGNVVLSCWLDEYNSLTKPI
jgi:hypothetical protein